MTRRRSVGHADDVVCRELYKCCNIS